ncbi:unnamed protein product [Gadus morhua 'NCC']
MSPPPDCRRSFGGSPAALVGGGSQAEKGILLPELSCHRVPLLVRWSRKTPKLTRLFGFVMAWGGGGSGDKGASHLPVTAGHTTECLSPSQLSHTRHRLSVS